MKHNIRRITKSFFNLMGRSILRRTHLLADKPQRPTGYRPCVRHKALIQPVGQAVLAEWVIQRDLDGQPRAAGFAEG